MKTSLPDYYSNYRKERGEVKTGENEMEEKKKNSDPKIIRKIQADRDLNERDTWILAESRSSLGAGPSPRATKEIGNLIPRVFSFSLPPPYWKTKRPRGRDWEIGKCLSISSVSFQKANFKKGTKITIYPSET